MVYTLHPQQTGSEKIACIFDLKMVIEESERGVRQKVSTRRVAGSGRGF